MSRTPQGVRGLKLHELDGRVRYDVSHPARGAWIEIGLRSCRAGCSFRRTPQGVRGLKLFQVPELPDILLSHPARGAWIEIAVTGAGAPE